MGLECRDEGGPCGGVGGAEEGREECSEGGRSAMMCGGDGGNMLKIWLRVGCGWWCGCLRKNKGAKAKVVAISYVTSVADWVILC